MGDGQAEEEAVSDDGRAIVVRCTHVDVLFLQHPRVLRVETGWWPARVMRFGAEYEDTQDVW